MAPRVVPCPSRATREQVLAHRQALLALICQLGLELPRLRDDGTVVVRSHDEGYRTVARLSAMASELIGSQVHVITDDVPGANGAREL